MTITLRPGSTVVFTGDSITDCQRLESAPYVAITRATRRLTVTHRGDLPGMLARLRRH